ncbi:MAG: carboxypeptidase-like regulatory domain-containing protein [Vicinamibacteria bacterium]
MGSPSSPCRQTFFATYQVTFRNNERKLLGFLRKDIGEGKVIEVDIELEEFEARSGVVSGRVSSSEDQARVQVVLEAMDDRTDRVSVRCDASGEFEIRGVPPGNYVLRFPSPQSSEGDSRRISVGAGQRQEVLLDVR